MISTNNPILALYGFRSKQEYIYRTNRMREITGASELIAGMFEELLSCIPSVDRAWRDGDQALMWQGIDTRDAVVVYEGGGNLCVLFKDRATYVQTNKSFSKLVLEKSHTLSFIAAGVEATDNFEQDYRLLYAEFDRRKRLGCQTPACNVVPPSLIDRTTFQPIERRLSFAGEVVELSREAACKRQAFDKRAASDATWSKQGKFIDELSLDKGTDSLIAVAYFDGNRIGEKLKAARSSCGTDYASQINALRSFSIEVHKVLVEDTLCAIKARLATLEDAVTDFRLIVDHGDEITLICNAHVIPQMLDAYFGTLEAYNADRGTAGQGAYYACAGVAICHSHDPFAQVYAIAEECCESAKKASRTLPGSYVDWHFCRSGITGTLEQIREAQEADLTLRPYQWTAADTSIAYGLFTRSATALSGTLKRGDIKGLANKILQGRSWYEAELIRLQAKDPSNTLSRLEEALGDDARLLLFDIAGIFDVWFADGESNGLLVAKAGDLND